MVINENSGKRIKSLSLMTQIIGEDEKQAHYNHEMEGIGIGVDVVVG